VNIPVVYEDEWLLIVDKPAGLLTIPTPKNEPRTLTSILNDELEGKNSPFRLHPCHRLDRETSGLIIYAKGKSMQQKMMELFRQKKVKKKYIAFVQGNLPGGKGDISNPIEGRSALTGYRTIAKRRDFSIVEVMPKTGRTNQIRIHFKIIGHPLVGETKYAFRRDYALRAKRACLHACGLEFLHPATGKTLSINVKLAKDLQDFLDSHAE
jgi:23S rRNA pseudouridine1911/1915/1917 synthase